MFFWFPEVIKHIKNFENWDFKCRFISKYLNLKDNYTPKQQKNRDIVYGIAFICLIAFFIPLFFGIIVPSLNKPSTYYISIFCIILFLLFWLIPFTIDLITSLKEEKSKSNSKKNV